MFYRNLLLTVGSVSLLVAMVVRILAGTDFLDVAPAFLFWYLMGIGTVVMVGGALADLWTRTASTLRSLEGQVQHLTDALQRVSGEQGQVAATLENGHEDLTPAADTE